MFGFLGSEAPADNTTISAAEWAEIAAMQSDEELIEIMASIPLADDDVEIDGGS